MRCDKCHDGGSTEGCGRLWNGIHFRLGEAGKASGRKLNQEHGFQAEGRLCVKAHDAMKELSIEYCGRRVM